jgi:hypothetical protein
MHDISVGVSGPSKGAQPSILLKHNRIIKNWHYDCLPDSPLPLKFFALVLSLTLVIPSASGAPKKKETPGKQSQSQTLPKQSQSQTLPKQSQSQTLPTWPNPDDPPALVTKEFISVFLSYHHEQLKVGQLTRGQLKKPQVLLPRFDGRFEIRLLSGKLLLDIIRFEFPLMGAAKEQEGAALGLDRGISASTSVKIPFNETITGATIVDRQTHKAYSLDLSPFVKQAMPKLRADAFRLQSFGPPRPTSPKNTSTTKGPGQNNLVNYGR